MFQCLIITLVLHTHTLLKESKSLKVMDLVGNYDFGGESAVLESGALVVNRWPDPCLDVLKRLVFIVCRIFETLHVDPHI